MFNLAKPATILKLISAVAVLYIGIISLITETPYIDTWGVNKTIGWAWDFCFVLPVLSFFTFIIILVFYGVLAAIKAKLHKTSTLLSIIFIVLVPVVLVTTKNCIYMLL
jgi:hypothetical protein